MSRQEGVPGMETEGEMLENLLEFEYSFGYDCRKQFNLCLVDPETLAFASGVYVTFFDTRQKKVWFRIGRTAGGIAHVAKNHAFNHLAIAENGEEPLITIHEWPSMKIVTELHHGTTSRYFRLAYSPDGLLLVSQGGEPDYWITVWNWRESMICLQCKSHVENVYNVSFAQTIPGHLTSSGTAHIKFWRMLKTFTGLKLKGQTGRFGKTEISDVIAVYAMPDETVISGCEWGNILLWDEGLIKLEVCRKNRETSHANYITQFEYYNGEIISVGTDGWIRFWFYESISQADLPATEKYLEIQPIYEFYIGESRKESSMLMSLQKREFDDPENTFWYAQDGNGGIWLIDLSTTTHPVPPVKILRCHAGPILSMDTADWGPFVCTVDHSGYLHIYDYQKKALILVHKFEDKLTRVLWLPCQVEATGSVIICAFASGVLRMIAIALSEAIKADTVRGDFVRLIQALKPHTESITALTFNAKSRLLVTASQDCTIFLLGVRSTEDYPELTPIGYIRVNSPVSCTTWNLTRDSTLLVGCENGECLEFLLPDQPEYGSPIVTYELAHCKPRGFKFQSVRSSIERELERLRQEEERAKRLEKRKAELAQLLEKNPHVTIDEEAFLMDFEEDPPLPEIYIPEVPNKALNVGYTGEGKIWILMGGYDAPYIYEYPPPSGEGITDSEPIRSRLLGGTEQIHSYLFYNKRKYLLLGMETGEIRVCRVNSRDFLDLSNYYALPVHDYYNGVISKMTLSYDGKLLLSCGHDGNLFSYRINDVLQEEIDIPSAKDPLPLPQKGAEDIEGADYPSLEEVVSKEHADRIMEAANRRKEETLAIVNELAQEFLQIVAKNQNLPPSQRISEFELDPRITEDLERQLHAQMELTKRKLAFKAEKSELELQKLMDHFVNPITSLPFAVVSPLNPEKAVYSLREAKLGAEFELRYLETMVRSMHDGKPGREMVDEERKLETDVEASKGIEHYFEDIKDIPAALMFQIKHMLGKYTEMKARDDRRRKEWKELQTTKPDLSKSQLQDSILLEETKKSIGEYKLKTTPTPDINRKADTACTKYKQLLNCRHRIHYLRENFNKQLEAVRSKKKRLQQEILILTERLRKIHAEIPGKHVKPLPRLPVFDIGLEFPEHNLEPEKYVSMAERMKQVKYRRQSVVLEKVCEPPVDPEYEVLLLDDAAGTSSGEEGEDLSTLFSMSLTKIKSQRSVHADVLKSLRAADATETSWEREAKRQRVLRKIYEQDCILRHIDKSYEDLEGELMDLDRRRLEIITETIYAELFLSTAYQEFLILRESEETQAVLEERQQKAQEQKSQVEQKIETATVKITSKEDTIHRLHLRIKELDVRFGAAVAQNKFQKFLLKVYRKKYSAKKVEGSETVSSEESSDDTESTASSDTGDILLDESICPPGCDRELYDMALSSREKRYEHEAEIRTEQKDIEGLHKEVDNSRRALKLVEKNLKSCQQELEAFILEKQRRLNEVDVTVILYFHQLQHVLDYTPEIKDCVVFDKKELSQLYARVGELQNETLGLEDRRKKNQNHLMRIKQDCEYMEKRKKNLEEEIKEETIKKFGRKVSLISVYEAVLQRMIYDAKADLTDAIKEFDSEIKCIKEDYEAKMTILENLMQDNTEKLSLLTVLEREKSKLEKILKKIPISEEEMQRVESRHRRDLKKLEAILERQLEQKELLERDIKNLRSRNGKLPPIKKA